MRKSPKRISQKEFEQRFKEKYGDEFIPITPYLGTNKDVQIRHKICGYVFSKKANALTSKKTLKKLICPKCNPLQPGTQVIPYINDLSVTVPEICEYLVNKEDSHKYRKNSEEKIWFRCPVCGREYKLTIANVSKNGKVTCPSCNDGFSYPNKLMANILQQLSIEFISEYEPDWIKPYKFDFYIPSLKIIIEMDGAMGHGNERNDPDKKLLERDHFKDQKAIEHNNIVIRINCCYKSNRLNYIKDCILKSDLSLYLDLSKIDWASCNQKSISSKIKELIPLIKSNYSPQEIKEKLCIKQSCLNGYIRILIQQGTFTTEEIKKYRNQWNKKKSKITISKNDSQKSLKTRKVFCYETGEIYNSAHEAEQKLGIKGIYSAIKRNGTCNKKHWTYLDTLPSDFDFSNYTIPIKLKQYKKNLGHIQQLNLKGELIRTFINTTEIYDICGYYAQNILRVCYGKRKTAYGYKWKFVENQA